MMLRFHRWWSRFPRIRLGERVSTRPLPLLSIVVVVFNMRREAPRTLFSLSPAYQQNVSATDYEVIVVDNGSPEPLTAGAVAEFGAHYRYLQINNASPSPANAINRGVALSQAPFVGIMIDGARIATPGIIHSALLGLQRFERAVISTVGFHLGPDTQMYSLRHGYNQTVEDELLDRSDWRNNGYRLFNIGALAGSSPRAWLDTINESNLIFLSRTLFDELGGYDERFTSPGGGIVNLDFYRRACDLPNSTLMTLFGEATFHQVHGGAITNQPASELPHRLQSYGEEYLRIRERPFERPTRPALLFGYSQPEIMPWLQKACDFAAATFPSSDKEMWRETPEGFDLSTIDLVSHNEKSVFSLLVWLGLRPHHQLLELGSNLPIGSLLIPYLQEGGYFGLEFTDHRFEQDIAEKISLEWMALKKPRFAHSDDFNLDVFDRKSGFDFILALSIFSHAGLTQIRRCLTSVRLLLKPDGLLVATFSESIENQALDAWAYPDFNLYCWSRLASLCAELGLHCRKLDWPDPTRSWFAVAIYQQRLAIVPTISNVCRPDYLKDVLLPPDEKGLP